MRLPSGGNYTQPVVDDDGNLVEVIAYVGWSEVGRFPSEPEAAQKVREGVNLASLGIAQGSS